MWQPCCLTTHMWPQRLNVLTHLQRLSSWESPPVSQSWTNFEDRKQNVWKQSTARPIAFDFALKITRVVMLLFLSFCFPWQIILNNRSVASSRIDPGVVSVCFPSVALTCVRVARHPGILYVVTVVLVPDVMRTLLQREFIAWTLNPIQEDGTNTLAEVGPGPCLGHAPDGQDTHTTTKHHVLSVQEHKVKSQGQCSCTWRSYSCIPAVV